MFSDKGRVVPRLSISYARDPLVDLIQRGEKNGGRQDSLRA
jgi:hypothetical protein